MLRQHRYFKPVINTVICSLGAALLATVGWLMYAHPFFKFKSVVVESMTSQKLSHVTSAIIDAEALPLIEGNFFTADLDQARHVLESVAWVRHAEVRREWPDHLIVRVEEHKALGTWGYNGMMLSQTGEVFLANAPEAEEDTEQLPEFDGPDNTQAEVFQRYGEIKQALAPLGIKPVAVHLSPRYAWQFSVDSGMTVELGRENEQGDVKNRLNKLLANYQQLIDKYPGKIEHIDLRYPAGLTLQGPGFNPKPTSLKK